MHGCDRRPVGDSRTGIPTEATVRLAGTTLARHAVGAQWRALDSAHRRPVARTSLQVSALSDLSSAFPILAAFGVADPRAAKTGRGLTRPRPDRTVANLHRRQLQFGLTSGAADRPTRRRPSSNITSIADRHALPVVSIIALLS